MFLDLLFVLKDAQGVVTSIQAADIGQEGAAFLSIDTTQPGALGHEDAEEVGDDLRPTSFAALLIAFENLWAAKVVDALQAADAVLIDSIRIPVDVVQAFEESSLCPPRVERDIDVEGFWGEDARPVRRDIFIENDSGGLSVIAAAAADAIIEDGRENDLRFVEGHQALLLMLYGDDSLPVRVVVDEPLTADEEREWLARVSWKLDAPDGRLLVMGGFDPDVLAWWRDEGDPDADGRGVGVIAATPGQLARRPLHARGLDERPRDPRRARRAGRRVLPPLASRSPVLRLARRTCSSSTARMTPVTRACGGTSPRASRVASSRSTRSSRARSASSSTSRPFDGPDPQVPDGGWFDWEDGRRVPDVCPVGLPAQVPDAEGESFLDALCGGNGRPSRRPPQRRLSRSSSRGRAIRCARSKAARSRWPLGRVPPLLDRRARERLAARLELWVDDAPGWVAPAPTAEFGVVEKSGGIVALGAPPNSGGWWLWWGARAAAQTLSTVPDGASLDLRDDAARLGAGRARPGGRPRALQRPRRERRVEADRGVPSRQRRHAQCRARVHPSAGGGLRHRQERRRARGARVSGPRSSSSSWRTKGTTSA